MMHGRKKHQILTDVSGPETAVRNYQYSQRDRPEERRFQYIIARAFKNVRFLLRNFNRIY
jgi:hypothetical protein